MSAMVVVIEHFFAIAVAMELCFFAGRRRSKHKDLWPDNTSLEHTLAKKSRLLKSQSS